MGTIISFNEHRLEDIELVVFDKDGTLIDVHTYWAGMIELRSDMVTGHLGLSETQKRELMESMGVDTKSMRIKPEGPVGLKKREVVMQAGCSYLESEGFLRVNYVMEKAFRETDQVSLKRFDMLISPLKGMGSLLKQLKTAGCKIAIATTDLSLRARLAFEYLDMLDFIDFIAGADMVSRPKPAGDIVQLVCDKLDVLNEKTIMLGDAPSDILAGQNAGCRASIGVSSGLTPVDELEHLTPYVVASLESIFVDQEY